jgi:hypothetical protein
MGIDVVPSTTVPKTFRDRLEARGIYYKRQGGTGQRGYQGIQIKPAEPPQDHHEPYWK